jgi:hypothetical protein
MKQHTADFKNELTNMGKRLDSIVTYGQTTLHDELYSASLHYEGSILKSVMKQLDLECSIELPLNAVINYQLGVKIGNSYEYLNYGNYVVYKVEKQEDKKTYKITCYDKMLYSMKDYEDMNIVYPISIKDYISAICLKLGISFKNYLDNFANNDKEIQNELYLDTDGNSLGYTFRDVLDELAQVTGSIICIDEATDMLEIRYPNQTNDTIDEQFLKNINVNFGEKYGAVNLLTLSRSADSDIIYYPDVIPENPCEIKIVDNQIMNFNDRDTYMPDIYSKIQGLDYYINDFNSIGILYYDLYDIYNVKIGEQTYKCIMLNNEINVTSGLEEIIHTEMPEEAETDYTKADKTDRRINQTYLIVNKQEQEITSLVNQIGDRSEKTTTITQDIDGIQSIVEDYEDLTREAKGIHSVTINDAYPNEYILELHIYGNNSVFDYLYPRNDLYPDNTLYPYGDSRIRFYNDEEDRTIELGIEEVLRANSQVKDELFIDYQGNVSVIRRVNSDGTTKATPVTTVLGQLHFKLIEGNNTFEIVNYNAPIEVKYGIKSTFTDMFATKAEMNSEINQTAQEIDLKVNKKLENYSTTVEMNAQIEITAEEINSEVSKKVGNDEVISKINQSAEAVTIQANKIGLSAQDVLNIIAGNSINLSSKNITISSDCLNIDERGNINMKDLASSDTSITVKNWAETHRIYIGSTRIDIFGPSNKLQLNQGGLFFDNGSSYINSTQVGADEMYAYSFNQRSQKELKENIKKINKKNSGINILKNADICEFNFKGNEHKQIGVVIGDEYNIPEEILSEDKKGIDLYSMVSIVWKAVQEQQEQIEQLQKEIKELKGEK